MEEIKGGPLADAVTCALIRRFGIIHDGKLLPRMSCDPPPSDAEIYAHMKKPSASSGAKGSKSSDDATP